MNDDMRLVLKLLSPILLIMTLLVNMSGCGTPTAAHRDAQAAVFASYKDIPGVTQEEIDAVEALRKTRERFVYGMTPSVEMFTDEHGETAGFAVKFCDLLTQLFGIPFTPAFYEWDELVAGLAAGDIDFTGELTATDERRKTYFMTDPVALRTVKIFRLADAPHIDDIARTRAPRFAFFEGVTTVAQVGEVSEHAFEPVFAETYDAIYSLLKNGEADAFLNESVAEYVFDAYDGVVSKEFFPLIFSGVSMSAQNPSFAPVISVVQKYIAASGNRHLSRLYEQGYRAYRKKRLHNLLTEEERAYLRRGIPVTFLAEHDNYPTSFYNAREDEWQGIAFDVLREIELFTGLAFEVINDRRTPWNDLKAMLERGDGSMVSELIYTPERAGRFAWARESFATDYIALLSRDEFRNININEILNLRVGAVRGILYAQKFKQWFPSHPHFIEYDNADQLFHDLEHGVIDLAMASRNQLLYLTNFREQPGFKVNYQFNYRFGSTFGYYTADTLLRDIIDKVLRQADIDDIATNWLQRTYDHRIREAQARNTLILWVGVLLLCKFTLVVWLLTKHDAGKRLKNEVLARTADLRKMYAELEELVRMNEHANSVKGFFLTKIAREIRAPVNSIIGITEIARRGDVSENMRGRLRVVKETAARVLAIINDIADFMKIENGELEIVPANYYFAAMARDVANEARTTLANSSVKFFADIDANLPPALAGDKARVKQILQNILENAVKYTSEGSITFSVRGSAEENGGILLTIKIADTGKGMHEEDVAKFFGGSELLLDKNAKIEGTGLGLTITKALVRAMDGEIGMTSRYGKGSVVTITLPQKVAKTAGGVDVGDGVDTKNVVDDDVVDTNIVDTKIGADKFVINTKNVIGADGFVVDDVNTKFAADKNIINKNVADKPIGDTKNVVDIKNVSHTRRLAAISVKTRHFFVINPHSFRAAGSLDKVTAEIHSLFSDDDRLDYEIYLSRRSRDAVSAVHRYVDALPENETARIYAVGGDGILYDCLNGMITFPNAELTNAAYGNANDFVRAFGENARNEFRDFRKLLNAPSRPVDVIRCGSNYAINQMGIGLEAQSTISTQFFLQETRSKLIKPFVKYIYSFCYAAALFNDEVMNQRYGITLDGKDAPGAYYSIHISNGPCGGGKMVLDPYKKPNDGTLGAIFGRACSPFTALKTLGDFTKGHFEKHEMYSRKEFKKMEVKSDAPLRAHLDGESFYAEDLDIEIVPGGVKFFAPAGLEFADYSHMAYKGGRKK